MNKAFNELEEYTCYHFSNEETHFVQYSYAEKDSHILEHKEFIRRLAQMRKQIPEGAMDAEDLLSFLVDWIKQHIRGSDHRYVSCFHEHGFR